LLILNSRNSQCESKKSSQHWLSITNDSVNNRARFKKKKHNNESLSSRRRTESPNTEEGYDREEGLGRTTAACSIPLAQRGAFPRSNTSKTKSVCWNTWNFERRAFGARYVRSMDDCTTFQKPALGMKKRKKNKPSLNLTLSLKGGCAPFWG